MLPSAAGLTALCGTLAGGLFFACLYYLYVRHLSSPFRSLPSPSQGPFWLRLFCEPRLPEIEHWIDTIPNKGLIRYHGLFNRERIFITSPGAAKELLLAEAYKFMKPELQSILSENISGRRLLTLKGEEHKKVRKLFNPAFSSTNLNTWFPGMWKTAIDALNTVPRHTEVNRGFPPDHGKYTSFASVTSIQIPIATASIDMIGHFGYHVEFDTINTMASSKSGAESRDSKNKRKRFGRAFVHLFKTTRRGQITLQVASIIGAKFALKLPLRAVKTIKSIMRLFYDVMGDMVNEHISAEVEQGKGVQAPVDIMTYAVRTGALSHADLIEEGVHMISGGTETSIGTATWAMHLLSRHPKIQERLRDEIRANIPSPCDEAGAVAVERSRFHKLPYLNAIANKILRYHSVNGLLWRDCIEPATVGGVSIPKGNTMVFSPWALNRDPKHWGPSARIFDPDRWINDPCSGGADHPYSFLTFGGGPRRCIGEQYARDQLLSVICA